MTATLTRLSARLRPLGFRLALVGEYGGTWIEIDGNRYRCIRVSP